MKQYTKGNGDVLKILISKCNLKKIIENIIFHTLPNSK